MRTAFEFSENGDDMNQCDTVLARHEIGFEVRFLRFAWLKSSRDLASRLRMTEDYAPQDDSSSLEETAFRVEFNFAVNSDPEIRVKCIPSLLYRSLIDATR